MLRVGDGVSFAAGVVTADGLIAKIPDFDDGWIQTGKVHNCYIEVHTWGGLYHDCAFVFFAFYDGGSAGFSFFAKSAMCS